MFSMHSLQRARGDVELTYTTREGFHSDHPITIAALIFTNIASNYHPF